jgi:hypothetical protein
LEWTGFSGTLNLCSARWSYGRRRRSPTALRSLIFYSAFIEGKLEAPRSLLPDVRLYLKPQYEEFAARTMCSLSNAFTSTLKKLDPVSQFKTTAKLGGFLSQLPA